jgi:hypothetical protein
MTKPTLDISKACVPIARRIAQAADLDYYYRRQQPVRVECGWAKSRATLQAIEQARREPVRQ